MIETRRGHPGRRTMLLGLIYGGFAALVLYFLFWSLTDSHLYIIHSLVLGGIIFLASWYVGVRAERHGSAQKERRETLRAGGERKPTSEMRWENRPQ
jgi:hypothetical protein